MEELYFSATLGDERNLFLASLTERQIQMCENVPGDTSGYFLFEKCGRGELANVEIIAQVFSEDAVMRLREIFNME